MQVSGQGTKRERSNQSKKSLAVVPRGATGPRTQQGKDKSKNNALKHGVFSKPVVLEGESQSEFRALHNGLRQDFQPVGTLEEILVEKLAALIWRNRRLIIAEGAEIGAGSSFCEWDLLERYHKETSQFPTLGWNGGLIRWMSNPEALEGCLALLVQLRDTIEADGFQNKSAETILTKLYGDFQKIDQAEDWQQGLRHSFWVWSNAAAIPEEKHQALGLPSPQICKDSMLTDVETEIKRLERYKKAQAAVFNSKLELESRRHYVPDAARLDRLLRYETTLDRGIERVLNQLERLQRARRGQPVPPAINLNVTAS